MNASCISICHLIFAFIRCKCNGISKLNVTHSDFGMSYVNGISMPSNLNVSYISLSSNLNTTCTNISSDVNATDIKVLLTVNANGTNMSLVANTCGTKMLSAI